MRSLNNKLVAFALALLFFCGALFVYSRATGSPSPLADLIGSGYLLLMMIGLGVGRMGDEWYLTVPAILIAAVAIFLLNYFVQIRFKDSFTHYAFRL